MTDAELAKRVAVGDVSATQLLIDRFHASLVRYLWMLCGSREDGHDLAVEALLQVRQDISQFRGECLAPWVYRIAHRRLLTWRRRELVRLMWLRGQTPKEAPQPGPDAVLILEALKQLPVSQMEAFVLCDANGLTTDEAAAVIGVPAGTVKSRCFHARKTLQQILAPSYPHLNSHDKPVTERS